MYKGSYNIIKNNFIKIIVTITITILVISISPIFALETTYPLAYDNNSNLVSGLGLYYEYNDFNQLERVRENNSSGRILEEYVYDHEGKRLKKVEYNTDGSNITTLYINDNFIHVINSTGETYNETYYYSENQLVAKKNNTGGKLFYHPDHLGSVNLVTDENGNVVEYTTYLPYGDIYEGGDSRYLFTGKEKDKTGLDYFGARYYNPSIFMHFTQPDTNIPDIYNPQDLNRFSYVRNNPYKYVDESGDIPLIPIVAAGLVGGALSFGITYYQTGDVQKAAIAGGVGAVASAASVALVTVAGVTAAGTSIAGGLRYVGIQGAKQLAVGGGLATIGAGRSVAEQTLIEGRGISELSYSDIGVSAGINTLSPYFGSTGGLPGTITRTPGQFYPSTLGAPLLKEAVSQSAIVGYSEVGKFGIDVAVDQGTVNYNQYYKNQPTGPTKTYSSGGSGRSLKSYISSWWKSVTERSKSQEEKK